MKFKDIKWDLGIRGLLPQWKAMFSLKGLRQDLISGLTVGGVAIPLSLALALASKVDPAVGLVTAIVAGIVCALFGGTPLSVSGPANAMAVVVAASVEEYGLGGLLVIGMGCGVLQLLTGFFGLGKLIRFVPQPVVSGFMSGIGVIILISQLPRALGLQPPDQGHVINVINHIGDYLHDARFSVVAIAALTLLIAKVLPRISPKLPAPLLAVAASTTVVAVFGIDIPLLGHIPSSLPNPKLPELPTSGYLTLIENMFLVFGLASLETLLSSAAVDKLVGNGKKHDPDQEMIGQGLGNIAVAAFGGIPVTGVIARSALNVRAGAVGRRSAIFHSIFLICMVYFGSKVIGLVPIAALAGMLISVAISMIHVREFTNLLKTSKQEGIIYGVTFLCIVFLDLIEGIQAGMIAALAIGIMRLGGLKIFYQRSASSSPARLSISGPVTFLSSTRFSEMASAVAEMPAKQRLIFDLSRVSYMDTSGAEMLLEFVESTIKQGHAIALKALPLEHRNVLDAVDAKKITAELHGLSEEDTARVLKYNWTADPRGRLVFGVERFRREERENYRDLFHKLGEGQTPHTLFITCSDSRIVPNLITSTDPGELFIVRNVGNIIPRHGEDRPAEGAALEYALHVLNVKEIILCGHTGCGAVASSFLTPENTKLPYVNKWLADVYSLRKLHQEINNPDDLLPYHVKKQIENLLSYPLVTAAVKQGKLAIRAWLYDVKASDIWEWDDATHSYKKLGATKSSETGEFPRPSFANYKRK